MANRNTWASLFWMYIGADFIRIRQRVSCWRLQLACLGCAGILVLHPGILIATDLTTLTCQLEQWARNQSEVGNMAIDDPVAGVQQFMSKLQLEFRLEMCKKFPLESLALIELRERISLGEVPFNLLLKPDEYRSRVKVIVNYGHLWRAVNGSVKEVLDADIPPTEVEVFRGSGNAGPLTVEFFILSIPRDSGGINDARSVVSYMRFELAEEADGSYKLKLVDSICPKESS